MLKKYFQLFYSFISNNKILFIAFTSAIVYLPFINKPFHMDDPFFLYAARAINISPLNPFSVKLFYNLFTNNKNPLFFFYFTGLARLIAGEHETLIHAFYYIFYLSGGVIFYFLCKNNKMPPVMPALLLLFSPMSLLTATSIMSDFPFIVFSLASIYLFTEALEKQNHSLAVLASAALFASIMTKYYGIIIAVVFIYIITARKKYSFLYYIIAPLALLGVWTFFTPHQNSNHFTFVLQQLGIHFPLRKETLSFLTTIGGISIFPFCWPALIWRRKILLAVYISCFLVFELIFIFAVNNIFQASCAGIYLANCLVIYFLMAKRLYQSFTDKDYLFSGLSLWFFGQTLFLAVLPFYMSGRYALPLLPPLVILFFREAKDNIPEAYLKPFLWATLILTLLLASALTISDYKLGSVYRDFAAEASSSFNKEKTGYLGDYGFAYYLDREGFKKFDPNKHEYLITAKYSSAHIIFSGDKVFEEAKKNYTIFSAIPKSDKFFLRIWDPSAFAGFHLNMFGYIPWGVSSKPMEVFYIYRKRTTDSFQN
jgi:hypothetical protein